MMSEHFRVDIKQLCVESPFTLFYDRWALLSAGRTDDWNTMTVSGGQLGILWSRTVATVYVRPQRYTLQFMDRYDYFTLSFFPSSFRDVLDYCGHCSGRTINKAVATGLTPLALAQSVSFKQAELVLVCRKLYRQQLQPFCFIDQSIAERNYRNDYHIAFTGEITAAYCTNTDFLRKV